MGQQVGKYHRKYSGFVGMLNFRTSGIVPINKLPLLLTFKMWSVTWMWPISVD